MKITIANGRIVNLLQLAKALAAYPDGEYTLIVEMVQSNVIQAKKRYFAMVTELAEHAGYMSKKEKELFKAQIKEQLGNESIKEMTDPLQIGIKIEELHQLAQEHYSFFFKPV